MDQYEMSEIVRKCVDGQMHPYAVDASGEIDAWEYKDGYILSPWGEGQFAFVQNLPESFE